MVSDASLNNEFLKWMRTDLPGLFLLGSVNRHITVHSQQCRAINLVHALIRVGGGLDDKSIAIVGAGFSGLTAAAYALQKSNAKVALFDTASRPLWLQDHCANRWLHPGIYDWPAPGSLEPRTSLPVLNWRAGPAGDVARQIRAEWERLITGKSKFTPRLETRVDAVSAAANDRLLLKLANGTTESFDIVVLAVGFGIEAGGLGRVSYWNDADGLDEIAPGSSVLVSGFGDGGLADVLRLCMPKYRQDNLIELVRHVPAEDRQKLVDWEERFRGNFAALDQLYQDLHVVPIVNALRNSTPSVQLTLTGQGHLYGQRSAILNRFLVSQLRKALGDAAFKLITAPVDATSLIERPDGRQSAKLGADGQTHIFDRIVLRLGPVAAFPRLLPLDRWQVGNERRQHWLDMPQSLDRTRLPLWDERVSSAAPVEPRQDFLAYESSSRPWCLVLQPPTTSINWSVRAREMLKRARDSGLDDVNPRPLVLKSLDALKDEASIKGAVRALCAADIVIADVTGYDSGVLLLLGIRAAVRRAVTITCTGQAASPELWDSVPFNLKELKLISLDQVDPGLNELVSAFSAGLSQSKNSANYLDLPVYDYVRQVSTTGETADAALALLLRAFKSYEDDRELFVESEIISALQPALKLLAKPRVETVIDQVSPRLAGQRLYEAIRSWQTCIADLTWWRPNVMFELGVRLAVTTNRTFCLIDDSVDDEKPSAQTRDALRQFLRPFSYDLTMDNFAGAFTTPISDWVYEAAASHFRTEQDHAGVRVDEFLEAAAPVKPNLQDVDLHQLYAPSNADYAAELRHWSVEMRCAAWYYLADREQPHRIRPIDLLDPGRAEVFDRFRKLGAQLKNDLAQRPDPRDQRLRHDIDSKMKESADLGAPKMAELLNEWRDLRLELRSGFDIPGSDDQQTDLAEQRMALIADYEDRGRQLTELAARLEEFDNPVSDLPLQAVRSDLRRFDIELRRFKGTIA